MKYWPVLVGSIVISRACGKVVDFIALWQKMCVKVCGWGRVGVVGEVSRMCGATPAVWAGVAPCTDVCFGPRLLNNVVHWEVGHT